MTPEDRARTLVKLAEPFDPREIKWRVTHTTKDGRRGAVVAYADPRAYQDRLNRVLTPAGWSSNYHVCTLNNITRAKGNNHEVMSGKVISTCSVTLDGIGTHTSTGEEWADHEFAMTASDAQAFKRACSTFGLGRYLYDLQEVWVDLDEKKQPKTLPQLPKWALPQNVQNAETSREPRSNRESNRTQATVSKEMAKQIERLRLEVAQNIYYEIVHKVGKAKESHLIGAERGTAVLEWLQRAQRGIVKARELSTQLSVGQCDYLFHRHRVESLAAVPSMAVLTHLVNDLIKATERAA